MRRRAKSKTKKVTRDDKKTTRVKWRRGGASQHAAMASVINTEDEEVESEKESEEESEAQEICHSCSQGQNGDGNGMDLDTR
jgi:hypothetical protein